MIIVFSLLIVKKKASTVKARDLAILAQAGCDANTEEQITSEGELFSYMKFSCCLFSLHALIVSIVCCNRVVFQHRATRNYSGFVCCACFHRYNDTAMCSETTAVRFSSTSNEQTGAHPRHTD